MPITHNYIRDFRSGEWESEVTLHGSNFEPPMPHMGQKQTSDGRLLMSALSPKADVVQRDWHDRFVPKADIGHFIQLSDRR
jgi:hypothetical protein